MCCLSLFFFCFFFFNDTATTEIYTLSLHDALPISDTDQPQPPQRATRRQLGVEAARGLVIGGFDRDAALPVAREPFPLVRKRGRDVGGRGVVETDEQGEGKLVGEEKRRRIRDFTERGIPHSESVHEVELQRARRAEPAAREIGRPVEHGLARGYISDSNTRGQGAGDGHCEPTKQAQMSLLMRVTPLPGGGAPPLCRPRTTARSPVPTRYLP